MPATVFPFKLDYVSLRPSSGATSSCVLTTYRAVAFVMLGIGFLTVGNQFIGQPIHCSLQKEINFDRTTFESYCWIQGIHVIQQDLQDESMHSLYIHDGVRPIHPEEKMNDFLKRHRFQSYYQWVPFVLLLASFGTYLPYLTWKMVEGGRLENLLVRSKADDSSPASRTLHPVRSNAKDAWPLDCAKLVERILSEQGLHCRYSMKYIACHVLAALVVLSQLWLIDIFLGGDWITYGLAILGIKTMTVMNLAHRGPEEILISVPDPMPYLFPRMGKCQLEYFSVVGLPQAIDGICILPLNIINEKIFIFVWVALVLLLGMTLMAIIFYLTLRLFPKLRSVVVQVGLPKGVHSEYLPQTFSDMCLSDWLLVRSLLGRIDAESRIRLLANLAIHMRRCPSKLPMADTFGLRGPLESRYQSNRVGGENINDATMTTCMAQPATIGQTWNDKQRLNSEEMSEESTVKKRAETISSLATLAPRRRSSTAAVASGRLLPQLSRRPEIDMEAIDTSTPRVTGNRGESRNPDDMSAWKRRLMEMYV